MRPVTMRRRIRWRVMPASLPLELHGQLPCNADTLGVFTTNVSLSRSSPNVIHPTLLRHYEEVGSGAQWPTSPS
jgi:hypothetical protein